MKKIEQGMLYDRNDVRVKVDTWWLLFYTNLFVYGFFGALVSTSAGIFVGMSVFVCVTQLFFGLMAGKQLPGAVYITFDIKTTALFLLVLLLVTYRMADYSLIGDELSYTQSALRHSMVLAGVIVKKISFFDAIGFKYLVLVINFCILSFLVLVIYYLQSIKISQRIAIAIGLMIILRVIIFSVGGNASPHPPLNHVFTFFTSSVLPLSNFSVRFSYILGFLVFGVSVYYLLRIRWEAVTAFLITCSIITIPPLLHLGSTVEQSLWTTCVFSYILVYLAIKNNIDYGMLIALGSILAVFRIPGVIILVPVFLLFMRQFDFVNYQTEILSACWRWLPVMLFLPFFLVSVIKGTPATDYGATDMSLVSRYAFAFSSGIILRSLLETIPVFWIFFILFAFIKAGKTYFQSVVYVAVFMTVLAVFYSIRTDIWGAEKYQDEIFLPFIVVGFIKFWMLTDWVRPNKLLLQALLVVIILLNLFYFNNYSIKIENGNIHKDYPYTQAYTYIKQRHAQDSTLSIGLTYGVLPEIINGYNSLQYKKAIAIYKDSERKDFSESTDIAKIDKDKRIRYVIVGYTGDKEKVIADLKRRNWVIDKQFAGIDILSTVLVLKRL